MVLVKWDGRNKARWRCEEKPGKPLFDALSRWERYVWGGKASKRKTKKTRLTPSREAVPINGGLTLLKEATSGDSVTRNAGHNMLLPGFSKRSGFSFCPMLRG